VPVRLPIIKPGNKLGEIIVTALRKQAPHLKRSDLVAVASKVVSICENRIVRLDHVPLSQSSKRIARRWRMDERLAALVQIEADRIVGGVRGFLLTEKNGILTANAGIDLKNSPPRTATLWPRDSDASAKRLLEILDREFKVKVGVLIVDSRVTPLRLGTIGLALGTSGFLPVCDERGKKDLYGREVQVTETNLADDLAACAHFLMGETDQRIGVVVLRNTRVRFGSSYDSRRAKLSVERCLIARNLLPIRNRRFSYS